MTHRPRQDKIILMPSGQEWVSGSDGVFWIISILFRNLSVFISFGRVVVVLIHQQYLAHLLITLMSLMICVSQFMGPASRTGLSD